MKICFILKCEVSNFAQQESDKTKKADGVPNSKLEVNAGLPPADTNIKKVSILFEKSLYNWRSPVKLYEAKLFYELRSYKLLIAGFLDEKFLASRSSGFLSIFKQCIDCFMKCEVIHLTTYRQTSHNECFWLSEICLPDGRLGISDLVFLKDCCW